MKQIDFENELGKSLKELRKNKNLTLRYVEEQTDISNSYLSQLENGKIANPSIFVIYKLSTIYGVSLDDLMSSVISGEGQTENKSNMKQVDFEQELYNRFGQVKDFTLGMRIAKYFYEMGSKSQWISTNERLPEEEFDDGYTFVFVRIKIDEDTYMISTDYIRNGKWELHRNCNITHWMTIPSI